MEILIDPREFISPPFGQSPRSGKQEFGVPTVAGDTYWRRYRDVATRREPRCGRLGESPRGSNERACKHDIVSDHLSYYYRSAA